MQSKCTQDHEMTLEERWPHLYHQLCEVREIVEAHFRDACDIEFTIENRQLYILSVRRAKRTVVANLRIVLQFFGEGKIGLSEAVSRISPHDVEEFVRPVIVNEYELNTLATGLPASPGTATGRLVLSRERAEVLRHRGQPYIFARVEVSPEDIHAMASSEGVLTARGGMTSHAAVACRGMRKPCVAGVGAMQLSYASNELAVPGSEVLHEGDWITINGSDGGVYAGEGHMRTPDWEDIPELCAVAQMIEQVLVTGDTKAVPVGSIWRIRDFFVHSLPLSRGRTSKRPTRWHAVGMAPLSPPRGDIQRARRSLHPVSPDSAREYSEILLGLSEALSRALASQLGLGNHHKYFRPLWDPEMAVRHGKEVEQTQLVAFEYFDVNRYVRHLPDVSDITFLLEVELCSEEDGWFLDYTNPDGESLVVNSESILACGLFVNGASVQYGDIPVLYNVLRKREYYWRWFEYNLTSHGELAEFLRQGTHISLPDSRLALYCEELGLTYGGELTSTGLSMIGKRKRGAQHGFFTK